MRYLRSRERLVLLRYHFTVFIGNCEFVRATPGSRVSAFGVESFRAANERTLALAQRLARGIEETPGLTLIAPVTLDRCWCRLRDQVRHTSARFLSNIVATD